MNPEIWKPVKGYEGLYDVSSRGRIRSYYRNRELSAEPVLLHPAIGVRGYRTLPLRKAGTRSRTATVHRLVAEAFIPNPGNLYSVNHKRGDKTDNRVEALEWMTMGDNLRHARATGLHVPVCGERAGNAKLTAEKVAEIVRRFRAGKSGPKVAAEFDITATHVYSLNRGEFWKHLTSQARSAERLNASAF